MSERLETHRQVAEWHLKWLSDNAEVSGPGRDVQVQLIGQQVSAVRAVAEALLDVADAIRESNR